MKIVNGNVMASKFRGALLGALIGDCCGATFEETETIGPGNRLILKNNLDKLCGPIFTAPKIPYTDDTSMTKSIAKTLIYKNLIDQKELAINFVTEYFKEPNRGYGNSIKQIFYKLHKNKCEDFLTPAREQFNGLGSFGNGAAMRISPISLFYFNNTDGDVIIDMAKKSSEITHTNEHGINGAILQALAVNMAFNTNPQENFDVQNFIIKLQKKMKIIENIVDIEADQQFKNVKLSYCHQLNEISKLLARKINPSDEEVVNILGHSVNALYSVPTAIYCFLRATSIIPGIETDNPFRRTIEYAISLGGDTDTIASMAGAISGAYFTDDMIPKNLVFHCESHEEVIAIANRLYEISNNSK